MDFRRLTQGERYQLAALLKSGQSRRGAAAVLGRDPATVSRELRRNTYPECVYEPELAHQRAALRAATKNRRPFKIQGELEATVRKALEMDWSPDQITGRLKTNGAQTSVCPETIYQYVYRLHSKDRLWTHLRRQHAKRRPRKTGHKSHDPAQLFGFESISKRPAIVESRDRLGDWERDSLLGTFNSAALLTLVDRKSRYSLLQKMDVKNAESAHLATITALKDQLVFTITNDQGNEFRFHHKTSAVLQASVYFTHPYSPWERGTNENTNGLLRQYFPRHRDISTVPIERVQQVQNLLNNRPRKCLGYKTPSEVYRP